MIIIDLIILFQLDKSEKGYEHCTCQVLRSISNWSAGILNTEKSIYKSYLWAIQNAKHFIYIGKKVADPYNKNKEMIEYSNTFLFSQSICTSTENQYFISSINRIQPKNKILKAIYDR